MISQKISKIASALKIQIINLLYQVRYDVVVLALDKGLDVDKGFLPIRSCHNKVMGISSNTAVIKISQEIMQRFHLHCLYW